jgi:hypothetical protein
VPTYQETVLSKSPFLFCRLDEASGDVITDLSGNGYNGEYLAGNVKGLNSPIETDASSKAVAGPVGIVSGAPAPTGAFSWGGWGLYDPARSDASGIVCRNGQIGTLGNFTSIDHGLRLIGARIHIHDTPTHYDLSYALGTNDGWYRVLVTRSTNVMRLYVNGILRAERTDLDVGDMDHPNYLSGGGFGWKLGITGDSGNVWAGAGTDEIDLYDYALSAADELEVYESAKLDLPLSVTIPVRVVVELDTDQVVPVNFPFTHNFAEPLSGSPRPIVEHLSWKTNTNQSEPDYQQRINAQPHHVERTLEYFVTPTSARARAMMQASLWTPGQTYTLPIAKDWGQLTAQATAGAATLSLDTTLRDYEVGSYVVAWEDVREPWTAQFFQITSITDLELGTTPDVGSTLPIGSPVMPARLAILPEDSLSPESHLVDRETIPLQFEILSTELSSRRVTEYTALETWLGIEVFQLERAKVEWVDPSPYEISRRQEGTGISAGNDYLRAIDTGSSQTIPIRLLLTSQQAISEFYGWMDARRGKANPVWVSSEEHDLEVVARFGSPGRIEINHIGYAARYNVHSARRHIVFRLADGSLNFKRITAAVDSGDTETLTLTADPPLLADIVKTSFLRLCTAPDQFELRYHRDGSGFIGECEFVMNELLTTPE